MSQYRIDQFAKIADLQELDDVVNQATEQASIDEQIEDLPPGLKSIEIHGPSQRVNVSKQMDDNQRIANANNPENFGRNKDGSAEVVVKTEGAAHDFGAPQEHTEAVAQQQPVARAKSRPATDGEKPSWEKTGLPGEIVAEASGVLEGVGAQRAPTTGAVAEAKNRKKATPEEQQVFDPTSEAEIDPLELLIAQNPPVERLEAGEAEVPDNIKREQTLTFVTTKKA